MKMFYELPVANSNDAQFMDKEKIKEIVEYDRYCCDYGLVEEERKLWHQDGTLVTTWFKGPVNDYLGNKTTAPKPWFAGEPHEMHNHRINNTVVWLKDQKAIAEVLCYLNFRSKLGVEWVDQQCWCRMHFRLEKREGNWGILYMEGIYEKDRMDPVFLDSNFNIPRQELLKFRPINWNMALRRVAFLGGSKNMEDWAGADKPETIGRLYEESSRFLGLD